MNQKDLPVITISREYAAGGRTVARALSERLGLPWYDWDFMKKTAIESGYSEEEIKKEGEELGHFDEFLDKILNSTVSYTSSHDAIFEAQKKVILELAASPCIIVGRCANIILQEAGIKTFDIFLYSDIDHRMKRASELKEYGSDDLKKYIEKRDALRANYYKHYTKHDFGNYHDYDILFNVHYIGVKECTDILENLIAVK